jgi:hypothetical protein
MLLREISELLDECRFEIRILVTFALHNEITRQWLIHERLAATIEDDRVKYALSALLLVGIWCCGLRDKANAWRLGWRNRKWRLGWRNRKWRLGWRRKKRLPELIIEDIKFPRKRE